jgi:hypothetical protein
MKRLCWVIIVLGLATLVLTGCHGKRLEEIESRLSKNETIAEAAGRAAIKNAEKIESIIEVQQKTTNQLETLTQSVVIIADETERNFSGLTTVEKKLESQKTEIRYVHSRLYQAYSEITSLELAQKWPGAKTQAIYFSSGVNIAPASKTWFECRSVKVLAIISYADNTGDTKKNPDLVRARAEKVKELLNESKADLSDTEIILSDNYTRFGPLKGRKVTVVYQ